jgi:hypothetical protein
MAMRRRLRWAPRARASGTRASLAPSSQASRWPPQRPLRWPTSQVKATDCNCAHMWVPRHAVVRHPPKTAIKRQAARSRPAWRPPAPAGRAASPRPAHPPGGNRGGGLLHCKLSGRHRRALALMSRPFQTAAEKDQGGAEGPRAGRPRGRGLRRKLPSEVAQPQQLPRHYGCARFDTWRAPCAPRSPAGPRCPGGKGLGSLHTAVPPVRRRLVRPSHPLPRRGTPSYNGDGGAPACCPRPEKRGQKSARTKRLAGGVRARPAREGAGAVRCSRPGPAAHQSTPRCCAARQASAWPAAGGAVFGFSKAARALKGPGLQSGRGRARGRAARAEAGRRALASAPKGRAVFWPAEKLPSVP